MALSSSPRDFRTLVAAASLSVSEEGLRFDSAGAPVVVVDRVETDSPPPKP